MLYRSQRGWGPKISIGFSKKVYNHLGNMASADCCQWAHTTEVSHRTDREDNDDCYKPGNTKGNNGLHRREERWWDQCILLSLIHNAGFISALKNTPTSRRSSKTISTLPGKGTKACRMLTENGTPLSGVLSSICAWYPGFRPQPFLFPPLSCKRHHQCEMKQSQTCEKGLIFH